MPLRGNEESITYDLIMKALKSQAEESGINIEGHGQTFCLSEHLSNIFCVWEGSEETEMNRTWPHPEELAGYR